MVRYWVVFYDIIRQVFLSLLPEYAEMILSYSVSDPITSHVYCSGYLLLCHYFDDSVCRCIVY